MGPYQGRRSARSGLLSRSCAVAYRVRRGLVLVTSEKNDWPCEGLWEPGGAASDDGSGPADGWKVVDVCLPGGRLKGS